MLETVQPRAILGVILLGLAAERVGSTSRWALDNPSLALAARWAWRAAVVLLALSYLPTRVAFYHSLAPGPWLDMTVVTLFMMSAVWMLWWIARPAVVGFPLNLPAGRPPLALWGLFALAEALTRQAVFATARSVPLWGEASPWPTTALLLAVAALPAFGKGHVRLDDLLLWVGLLGGSGLAFTAGSLWPAIVWDVWLVFAVGRRSPHQEVAKDQVGDDEEEEHHRGQGEHLA